MRYSHIFVLLFLLTQACSNIEPTLSPQNDEGQIILSVEKNTITSMIGFLRITLNNPEYSSIEKEFQVNDESFKDLEIHNIPIGTWTVVVRVYNNNEDLIFTGQTEVEVTKNQIASVEISTNPITGDIIIGGTSITEILNSLVAFYPFSGNTNDFSGNNIDGISYGPILTKDRFGNPSSAYSFDGANDYINVKRDEKLNIEGDLTISVWINPESFEGISNAILQYQADNSDNQETNALYGIFFRNSVNKLSYVHESGNGIDHFHTFENFSFVSGTWYHLVVVRKVQKKIVELYINGKKVDEIEYLENPENGDLSFLRIGEYQGTVMNQRFFHGIIDEIIILNKAISAEEIKYFYAFSK